MDSNYTLETNLNSDQIGILYSKLRGNCISLDTDYTTFKNAINACPISAMDNKKVKWIARANVLNCLLFGFGNPKQIGKKKYNFDGICTMKSNRCGLIINKVFDIVEKKSDSYITTTIYPMFRQGQIHGLNKLTPAVEYLNKQVYDKYNTVIEKKLTEKNQEFKDKEDKEEKLNGFTVEQKSPHLEEKAIEGNEENLIFLKEILNKLTRIETYLKIDKGVNMSQAANYLDVDMNEIYKLVALGEIKTDDNKMINMDDLIKYKTTRE